MNLFIKSFRREETLRKQFSTATISLPPPPPHTYYQGIFGDA
jgi:hypothetical protein